MNTLAQTQEIARLFNEAEATRQDFAQRRALRRFLGSALPLPDDVLDELDWIKSLATCRQTRAIALSTP
jgi:hypothetical protein